eukprot:Amastigsp_a176247_33.p5 type:complete len:132 gc:universal Amastigsp_a176247_33:1098-703(-)
MKRAHSTNESRDELRDGGGGLSAARKDRSRALIRRPKFFSDHVDVELGFLFVFVWGLCGNASAGVRDRRLRCCAVGRRQSGGEFLDLSRERIDFLTRLLDQLHDFTPPEQVVACRRQRRRHGRGRGGRRKI